MRRAAPLLVALAAVAAVLVPYAALGGGSYTPTPLADPCVRRQAEGGRGIAVTIERVALTGIDRAACKLGVSREDLVLALRDRDTLDRFAADNGVATSVVEQAVHDGVVSALDDEERSGGLSGIVGGVARRVIDSVPPYLLIDALERLGGFLR